LAWESRSEGGAPQYSDPAVGGNPPYFRHRSTGEYEKKRAFLKFNRRQMDPLRRFVAGEASDAEYFYSAWFGTNAIMGLSFEAVVACHAVHREACPSCGREAGFLRWTGGREAESAWRDMECVGCGSTFEIKSKKSRQHIHKDLVVFNNLRGGSFLRFRRLVERRRRREETKNGGAATGGKNYLVLVSRTAFPLLCGRPVWPVEIVEIDRVVPRLKDRSFDIVDDDDGTGLSIGSDIRVDIASRRMWFHVGVLDCDVVQIANDIYDEHFSSEERCRIMEKWSSGAMYRDIRDGGTSNKSECRSFPSIKRDL